MLDHVLFLVDVETPYKIYLMKKQHMLLLLYYSHLRKAYFRVPSHFSHGFTHGTDFFYKYYLFLVYSINNTQISYFQK